MSCRLLLEFVPCVCFHIGVLEERICQKIVSNAFDLEMLCFVCSVLCCCACFPPANLMAIFIAKLCYISWLRNVTWLIEQPVSSVLYVLPCMLHVIRQTKACFQYTCLGGFGGPIAKQTMLVGTGSFLWKLYRSKPIDLADHDEYYCLSWKKNGEKQVTGKKALQGTEHYPARFCNSLLTDWDAANRILGKKRKRSA